MHTRQRDTSRCSPQRQKARTQHPQRQPKRNILSYQTQKPPTHYSRLAKCMFYFDIYQHFTPNFFFRCRFVVPILFILIFYFIFDTYLFIIISFFESQPVQTSIYPL